MEINRLRRDLYYISLQVLSPQVFILEYPIYNKIYIIDLLHKLYQNELKIDIVENKLINYEKESKITTPT